MAAGRNSGKRGTIGAGGRAGFQPAGSWGILPQVSGITKGSNTHARLEAARTGRRGRLPYGAGHFALVVRSDFDLVIEPGASVGPPALGGWGRNSEHLSRLFDGQADE